jgi:hypothetical protein
MQVGEYRGVERLELDSSLLAARAVLKFLPKSLLQC